ncbi:hypothetical protein FALBO_3275 [Fusarium albosuccineum]|uniref:Uncharacterized protein n=1 Tax=Fusarium albosuccineum TaxID=1237068 RepID=A0A8H4LK36_9HYPO|nr:hypothetical protein FALBO_3275 [Fusarium albosuccineum]
MLSTPSPPLPELRRVHGHVSRTSRQQSRHAGRQSSQYQSQSQMALSNGPAYRRIASTSRGAGQVLEADAHHHMQASWSRGQAQASDPGSLQVEPPSPKAGLADGTIQDSHPRKRLRVSSPPSASIHPLDGGWSSHLSRDEGLQYTGSWCHSAPRDSIETKSGLSDAADDILAEDWRPRTPRESRLPTPDLAPISTDFEFCPCHQRDEGEDVRINEEYYFVSRSKMDIQNSEWV